MIKFKKMLAVMLAMSMVVATTGCTIGGKSNNTTTENVIDQETKELRQNDYRGGMIRLLTLKSLTLDVLTDMKSNNDAIRVDSPNAYWSKDGFEDFVSTFLESDIINDTMFFNEEETSWDYIVNYISTSGNSFTKATSEGYALRYPDMAIVRNEKDDYSIIEIPSRYANITGTANYRILYDCDKDWAKCVVTLYPSNEYPNVTINLLEYGRVDDNTFAIQTSDERFLVVLEDVKEDTDLRERKIKEFYYTKLSGGRRTTFKPVEYLPEFDDEGNVNEYNIDRNNFMSTYAGYMNDKGDLAMNYGYTDSMFLGKADIKDINADWVLADKALSQAVIYKDNNLVVVTYNKLTEGYERFIYVRGEANESKIDAICDMIEIENLKGINEGEDDEYIPSVTPSPTPDDDTHNPYDPDSVDYGNVSPTPTPFPTEAMEKE